jgi:hypothetical protein
MWKRLKRMKEWNWIVELSTSIQIKSVKCNDRFGVGKISIQQNMLYEVILKVRVVSSTLDL